MTSEIGTPGSVNSAERAHHARAGALLVAAALFMEYLDGTIIANALPHIARSFHVAAVDLDIGMTAYLIAVGIFIPLSGWVADRVGSRRAFTGAILGFTLASLGCAASGTLGIFVFFRILQGIAAAFMTPVGRLAVLHDARREDLVSTIALLTWPALLAPAIAPPLGGLIVEHTSWRWIFLINVPVGLLGAALVPRLLPQVRPRDPGPIDRRGMLLWAGSIALIVIAVDALARLGTAVTAALLAAAVLLGVAAWRHLRATPHPLLDLTVLRSASFAHAAIAGSFGRIAIMANPFLLPLLLQIGLGMPAAKGGVFILVGMSGNIAMKFATTPVLQMFTYRRVLLVNGALLAAGFGACAAIGPTTPEPWLLTLLVTTGMARSMQFTALNTLAFVDVEPQRMSAASTILSTVQQVNAALGVAISALIIKLSAQWRGSEPSMVLVDIHAAFVAIAALCLVGVLLAARLDPEARATIMRKAKT